jgi:Ser/Thr protein kinase RdoA (MazF antagonist)
VVPLADALVATYGFGEPPDCERLVRSSNDLVRIVTSGGTFWLKLANKVVRPLDDLESEEEVAAGLAARRLAVARRSFELMAATSARSIWGRDVARLCCFTTGPGRNSRRRRPPRRKHSAR